MRSVILSHRAADPQQRSRYHALSSLGGQLWLAVPHRWHPSRREEPFLTATGEDGTLQIVPVHVRGSLPGDAPARWNTRTISRLLRDVRPDIVHVDEEPGTQVAAVATAVARRLGLRTVISVRTVQSRRLSILQKRYARQALAGASGIIAADRAVADQVRPFSNAPMAIIPFEGVTPPLELGPSQREGFAIGFAGRLVPERGLDLLFQACVQVHGTWHLTVIGSGPEQESLERLAERLGIAARVSWTGGQSRTAWRELWPTLDCIVLPSRRTPNWYDPGGIHLMEAMAYGVPALVTEGGVLPDLVGKGGITVPEEDPDTLATALRALQHDPVRRRALSTAARQRALHDFTPDALARKAWGFWQRLSAASGAASA